MTMQHVFVYGSLKRGYRLHDLLANQPFVGEAVTESHYRLYDCGAYPALREGVPGRSIEGELYRVDSHTLDVLDEAEGVAESLYVRQRILLLPPHATIHCCAWFYVPPVSTLPDCGVRWPACGVDG